ncbi:response regulator [Ruthenibacterium lactatiformans]|uniref:response regulator n=1 Tax=Ruthenibacterium lactatiformans TaxID=1550024 RepID=UPI001883E7CF
MLKILIAEDDRELRQLFSYVLTKNGYAVKGVSNGNEALDAIVPFPVSWTVKMKKKQKETQDILSYHTQAAGCSDKARAKASGGRQPIEECGRTGL